MMHTPLKEAPGTIRCATCDLEAAPRGSFCGRCLTPYELSQSIKDRCAPAHYISVLGASNAGKTVYLGMLMDMLSKGLRDLRGVPNGAFAVTVQQQTMTALEQRRFPEKTSNEVDRWRWVHCEITRKNRPKDIVDLVTPDFAGEAIAMQVEKAGNFETIDYIVRKSKALMLLIDAVQVRDAGRQQDLFAVKLATYIRTLHGRNGGMRRGRVRVPLAIILTKADACWEARLDPIAFAKANLPGLVHMCERTFSAHSFFAAGVVGSLAACRGTYGQTTHVPLHTEPHGIIEPLDWIINNL
jgi:hypothetical protein